MRKVLGVVAEYNPFHNGHKRHLLLARKETNAEQVFVVMSGSFVQRGEPAIYDKYSRAAEALHHEASLVATLPAPFSTGAARTFAESAISYLDRAGFVTDLSFGAECTDVTALEKIAGLLADEPPCYQSALRDSMKEGMTYAAASARAVEECLGPEASHLMDGPNNLLGIEYLRALKLRDSSIRPCLVRRNADYTDANLPAEGNIASAGSIRKAIREGRIEAAAAFLPLASDKEELLSDKTPLFPDDLSEALLYRLFEPAGAPLSSYEDVSEELANRLLKERNGYTTLSDFVDRIKTRQITRARIARAICHILLNLRKEDMVAMKEADYGKAVHILGVTKDALPLIGQMKDLQPVIRLKADMASLDPVSYHILDLERQATELAEILRARKGHLPFVPEYSRKFQILP
ncbi:MAG: nucleotidyltransferase family protein [Lachnospiraceae bacterium]|nr:nucleotidyltransferase family protein [Lachnospiraceae bacterium]